MRRYLPRMNEERSRYRYWPLVTVSLAMVAGGIAGLAWDDDLSGHAPRTVMPMGLVYGLNLVAGLVLLAVAGRAWWRRRST